MQYTLTIPNGSNVSNALETRLLFGSTGHYMETADLALAEIDCPATLPSITSLNVQYSDDDGSTWNDLKDESGLVVSLAVSAGTPVTISPALAWRLPRQLRIKSNTNASASRAFVLKFRKV